DKFFLASGSNQCGLVTDVRDVGTRKSGGLFGQKFNIYRLVDFDRLQVYRQYLLALNQYGHVYKNLSVKTSGTHQRTIQNICAVSCCKNDDSAVGAKTIHLGEQLVECVFALVVGTKVGTFTTGPSNGINLI